MVENSEWTRWQREFAAIEAQVQSASASLRDDNLLSTRQLFVRHELLRMDLEAAHSHSEATQFHELLEISDRIRAAFVLSSPTKAPKFSWQWLSTCFTAFVIVIYTFLSVVAALFAMPLRLLHPVLRSVGVRNHFLPIDVLQKFFCRGWLWLCGVHVEWEGLQHVRYETPVIGLFTHASNMDPFIVASGPLAFKWIAKRSLFHVPLIGWTLAGWGHIPIDRDNLKSAVASFQRAIDIIRNNKRCLAVSPEGTRSKHGFMQDFKKGPFHACVQAQLPVQPILIQGAFQSWPPEQFFPRGGRVRVKILPILQMIAGEDHQQMSNRVRRAMLAGFATNSDHSSSFADSPLYVLWLPCILIPMFIVVRFLFSLAVSIMFG